MYIYEFVRMLYSFENLDAYIAIDAYISHIP